MAYAVGKCSNCNQRAELHQDPNDGKAVCEDCLTKPGDPLKTLRRPEPEPGHKVTGLPSQKEVVHTPRREALLDYIVAKAHDGWVEAYVKQAVEEYEARLREQLGWVEMIEQEQNERKLLRIAVSLGYVVMPELLPPPPPATDTVPEATAPQQEEHKDERKEREGDQRQEPRDRASGQAKRSRRKSRKQAGSKKDPPAAAQLGV